MGRLSAHPPRALSAISFHQSSEYLGSNWPKISLVIPSFNQGRYLEATLLSVINQRYPNIEILLVDGGSKDATQSVISKYEEHLTWWVSEPDTGQTAAINKGFRRSTGEIMAWLNSDDLLLPESLRKIASHFLVNPLVGAVYGNRVLINQDGLEIGKWILPGHSGKVLKWADFVPQETLFWRRTSWEKCGQSLDESFRFAMDWDFLLRLNAAQVLIDHLPSQMSSVGVLEMQKLRLRELGYVPKRWRIRLAVLVFLLKARYQEFLFELRNRR
jgi:glycosyltransferase involved in cell wall biosynthesis